MNFQNCHAKQQKPGFVVQMLTCRKEPGRLAREGRKKWSCAWYCELVTAISSHICLLISFGNIYSCLQYGMKTWSLKFTVCVQPVHPLCAFSRHPNRSPLDSSHLLEIGSVPQYSLNVTKRQFKKGYVTSGLVYWTLTVSWCLKANIRAGLKGEATSFIGQLS